jgi:hypothetical protein
MEKKNCPGAANLSGTPTLKVKVCPDCGNEVELFSTDLSRECVKCGFIAYNDITSCIKWCKAARECVGDEMFEELMEVERIKEQLALEEKAKKQAVEH